MIAIPAAEGRDSAIMAAGRRTLIMIKVPGALTSPLMGEVDDRHGCFPPHPVGFADSTSPTRGEVMLTLIGRRLGQLLPTLFFVSVIIFSLQQLLPGDPALVMAGEERDPAVIEQIRRQYRLDQPIPTQYRYWIGIG